HCVEDILGPRDLADLHGGYLHAPARRHQIHLGLEDVVDLLPLRQHIVQRDVPDDRAEGGDCDAFCRGVEILNLDETGDRVHDLRIDQKVHGDGRVVLRDAGLVRDLGVLLPEVHAHGLVDERDQYHNAGPFRSFKHLAQPEDHEPLVFGNDLEGHEGQNDYDNRCDQEYRWHKHERLLT